MIDSQRDALAVVERNVIPADEPAHAWYVLVGNVLRSRRLDDCRFAFGPGNALSIYPRRPIGEQGWPFLRVAAAGEAIAIAVSVCDAAPAPAGSSEEADSRWTWHHAAADGAEAAGPEFDRLLAIFNDAVRARLAPTSAVV